MMSPLTVIIGDELLETMEVGQDPVSPITVVTGDELLEAMEEGHELMVTVAVRHEELVFIEIGHVCKLLGTVEVHVHGK